MGTATADTLRQHHDDNDARPSPMTSDDVPSRAGMRERNILGFVKGVRHGRDLRKKFTRASRDCALSYVRL
jgi:hypothetical protein